MVWWVTLLTGLVIGILALILAAGRQTFGFIITILIGSFGAIFARNR